MSVSVSVATLFPAGEVVMKPTDLWGNLGTHPDLRPHPDAVL